MSHLVPKVLTALPFVDRAPDPTERPDQRRIEWIRNGDCLGAAEHINDNKGELNRGPVQVQRNAATLYENEQIIDSSLKEIIARVNAHDDALGDIGDDNLATKVQELEETVEPMAADITANKLGIFLAGEDIKGIKKVIGERPAEDPTERDVMNDFLFIKKEMGNYAGKDINGNDTLELNEPTGMKARIVNNGLSIQSNTRRIQKLEADWVTSDVGALQANLDQIRTKIGQTEDAPVKSIYGWIADSDTKQAEQDASIDELKTAVGIGSGSTETLDDRITANTTAISNNRNDINSIDSRTITLEQKIGDPGTPQGMEYRLVDTERKVTSLNNIVGETPDDGLRKQVQDVMNEIGSDNVANTIKGRLATNESEIADTQRSVATLQTQVGDSTPGSETGMFKRIFNLETSVEGDGTTPGLTDQIKTLTVAVADKVEEANADGKSYARNNKKWVEIVTDSVEEAPQDNGEYVRSNGIWKNMFESDFTVPDGKKVVLTSGGSTVEALSATGDKLVIGKDAQNVDVLGVLGSVVVGSNFTIKSGAQSTNKISITDNTVELGATGVKTIVRSSAGSVFQVNTGGGFYDVLHEGNFTDNATDIPMVRSEKSWKPMRDYVAVRSKGGVYFETNDTKIELTADTPVAVTDVINPILFNWSADFDVTADGFRYTGKEGKVFQLISQAMVKSASTDSEIEFHIYKNAVDTMIRYTIKGNMWNIDNSAYAFINFPIQLSENDTLKIYAMSKGKDSEIVVESATLYTTEM